MKIFLQNNNSKNLILFFCGWGMDETPFSILKTNCDILYVYDYKTPNSPEFDFSKYDNIKLIAFSYGVYASAIANLPKEIIFSDRIAINGTLIPVDDKYGVPLKQFELTEKMDSQTVVKFRERLFGGENAKEHYEIFEKSLPNRTAQSCTEELIGMKNYVPTFAIPQNNFKKVYIAKHDRCVPTKNQLNFWQNQNEIQMIELNTGHFPFYNFKSLDEL